ncbi:hypothetical protein [Polaromonas sp.]|uniref:hypothetical protein n=1 Tax=Polaromonas sp. TaxID=1869339 RepID=UPI003CB4CE80
MGYLTDHHRGKSGRAGRGAALLAAAVVAALMPAFAAMAQQQLPGQPGKDLFRKTPFEGMTDQRTPVLIQGGPAAQRYPFLDDFTQPAALAKPAPISCKAFKGSAEDMSALRKTAREAAGRRAMAGDGFDQLIPRNCAGQEWAFYLLFLSNVGEGKF